VKCTTRSHFGSNHQFVLAKPVLFQTMPNRRKDSWPLSVNYLIKSTVLNDLTPGQSLIIMAKEKHPALLPAAESGQLPGITSRLSVQAAQPVCVRVK
jgi:hypothetical protein